MKRDALLHLVHPDTLKPLQIEVTRGHGESVDEANLRGGSDVYRLEQGIPTFVSEGVAQDQTVQSFAQKWSQHKYYRTHTEGFYTQWYLDRYGFKDLAGLRAFLADKRFVLDAGTGAGRDSANFGANSDATVYAIDTSLAALRTFGEQEAAKRVNLVNADVNRLPFPDEFFDFVNCDQVIHHTPDPPLTFKNLAKKLKRGGQACCYVYAKKAVVREFTDDHVREQISELPIERALELCEGITKLGKILADMKATITLDQDIEVLGIKKGQYDLQRFVHWNLFKCFWNEDFDFFTNNIVNVDWYHPRYCFRYTPDEFRAWFAHGWEILAWDVQEAGISCRARKL